MPSFFFHFSFRGREKGWEEEKCNDILGRHHFWQHHLQVHALHPCCLERKKYIQFQLLIGAITSWDAEICDTALITKIEEAESVRRRGE